MKKAKYKSSHYWISFAYPICQACRKNGVASFVGVAIVPAKSESEALRCCFDLEIHPAIDTTHGHRLSVESHPLPEASLPEAKFRNRLLGKEDLDEIFSMHRGCSCGCGKEVSYSDHVISDSTEPVGADNRYYWLSFADRKQRPSFPFLGVAIVECEDGDPVQKTWDLDINPGGSVMIQPLSPKDIEFFEPYLGTLITNKNKAELLSKLMS